MYILWYIQVHIINKNGLINFYIAFLVDVFHNLDNCDDFWDLFLVGNMFKIINCLICKLIDIDFTMLSLFVGVMLDSFPDDSTTCDNNADAYVASSQAKLGFTYYGSMTINWENTSV